MTKMVKLFVCALFVSSFAACADFGVTGVDSIKNSADVAFIVDGKTTESQVLKKLGKPGQTINSSIGTELIYDYNKEDITPLALISGTERVHHRQLDIWFDKNGIAIRHFYSKTNQILNAYSSGDSTSGAAAAASGSGAGF